jgi:hypothetical protein
MKCAWSSCVSISIEAKPENLIGDRAYVQQVALPGCASVLLG